MVKIALADGIGHIAQLFDRPDNLQGHPARQSQADDEGQQDRQESHDSKSNLKDSFRRQVDISAIGIERYRSSNSQMNPRRR